MPKAEDLFCILFYYFTMTFGFVNFTSWVNFRKGLPIFLVGIGKSCTGFFNFSLHLLRSCFFTCFHFYGLYLTTWITLRHNRCLTCLYVCPQCCRWNTQLLSWGFGSVLFSLSLTVSHCCVCILKYSVLLLIISFVFYLPPPCACVSAVLCVCVCALVCSNITFRFVIFDFQLQLHTICLFNWISDVFVVYFPSISLFCICFFSSRSPSSLMLTPYNKNEQRSKNESFIFSRNCI